MFYQDVFRPAILLYLTMFLAGKLRASMNQLETASADFAVVVFAKAFNVMFVAKFTTLKEQE